MYSDYKSPFAYLAFDPAFEAAATLPDSPALDSLPTAD